MDVIECIKMQEVSIFRTSFHNVILLAGFDKSV